MKKILTAFILAITVAFGCLFISACDSNYYKVTVTGADDFLYEPLKSKYNAGTEVEIKIDMVTDIGIYVFVNDERINQSGWNNDNYYVIYKFTMPEENVEVYITTNEYHGVEECAFGVPFYWVNGISPENVVRIKREQIYYDGSPKLETTYTTDKTDIGNICAIFNCKLKPCDDPKVTGGSYVKYTFYTADAEYELPISSGCAVRINFSSNDYFKIIDFKLPEILNPEQ